MIIMSAPVMPYKTIFSIALVMALRMLGLFMMVPLLALYAMDLPDATPFLLGITLGIYGLVQACLQMPFGILSDIKGRKIVITLGLALFSVGSVIAASAHSIIALMIGRALQGSGAVGSALMALVSDLTDERYRGRAMAILGGVIGVSFSLSIILGPVLNTWISVPGIFLLCAAMGIIAIIILLYGVPSFTEQPLLKTSRSSVFNQLKQQLLTRKKNAKLNISSMLLHAILMMTFISVPAALKNYAQLAPNYQWQVYLPVLLLSFIVALGWITMTERKKNLSASVVLAVGLILSAQLTLIWFHYNLWQIGFGLWLFFLGFNFLEAMLPAELSRQVSGAERGMAMGLYSTMQFLGIFLGGLSGGLVYGHFSITGVFIFAAVLAGSWLITVL